jgi:hypothetical protein
MRATTMLVLAAALMAGSPMAAKAEDDDAFMQRVVGALQAQRNQAQDAAAAQQARAEQSEQRLAAALARIKELEAKPAQAPAESR